MTRGEPGGPGSVAWALAAFAWFSATAAPGLGWHDGGELAAGAFGLGIAHPPGEPFYLLLGRLAQCLPIGDLGTRLTLLSAATGAAAIGLVHQIATREAGPGRAWLGAAAAVPLAASGALWSQSTRIELYAPLAALLLGAFLSARRHAAAGGTSPAAVAGLLFGLALATHHALAVAALPALVVAGARPGGHRSLASACVPAALGATVLVFLPIRGEATPLLLWDDTGRLGGFLRSVTAAEYRRSFVPGSLGTLGRNAAGHAGSLIAALSFPGLALACLGAFGWARRSALFTVAWLGAVAGTLSTTLVQGVYDPLNPDAQGYHTFAFALVAVAAGEGARRLAAEVPPRWSRPGTVLAIALTGVAVLTSVRTAASGADQRGWWGARHLGRAVLDSVPRAGALVGAGDAWVLPGLYLVGVERWRDDVRLERLRGPASPLDPGAVRHVPVPAVPRPRVWGLLADPRGSPPGPPGPAPPDGDRLLARWAGPLALAGPAPAEPPALRFLAQVARGRACLLLAEGHPERALAVLEAAAARDPEPWRMIHLEVWSVRRYVRDLRAGLVRPGSDPVERDAVARALAARGDAQGAAGLWRQLLDERPGWPQALLGLDRARAAGIAGPSRIAGPP